MTSFMGREREEHDQLDVELDRLTARGSAGGAPSSDFGPTIDRLFQLASDAGVLTGADQRTPANRTDMTHPPVPTHPSARGSHAQRSSQWRSTMSFASMAAVALVVLTVTFGQYGYAPGGNDGEATRLAAQTDATPASTPVSDVAAASFRALTPADCTVEERTREDMLDVLSQLPDLEQPTTQSADTRPIDQATYDEVQAAYEEWQACSTFLLTWQQAALESDEYLRNDLYLCLRRAMCPLSRSSRIRVTR